MWIRSQNREVLMKVDGVDYQENTLIDGEKVEGHFILGIQAYNNDVLGVYKTKERALEILDEIQNYLSGKLIVNFNKECPTITDVENVKKEINHHIIVETSDYEVVPSGIPIIYEMPKE